MVDALKHMPAGLDDPETVEQIQLLFNVDALLWQSWPILQAAIDDGINAMIAKQDKDCHPSSLADNVATDSDSGNSHVVQQPLVVVADERTIAPIRVLKRKRNPPTNPLTLAAKESIVIDGSNDEVHGGGDGGIRGGAFDYSGQNDVVPPIVLDATGSSPVADATPAAPPQATPDLPAINDDAADLDAGFAADGDGRFLLSPKCPFEVTQRVEDVVPMRDLLQAMMVLPNRAGPRWNEPLMKNKGVERKRVRTFVRCGQLYSKRKPCCPHGIDA
ncbi:hypothetical protein AMAG_17374 [Allomyces macrogynus ATCC 38327]|uniref:Uncharacterized protein n=1 Tax=Allomyces macrogynus (strain ATCC 38327) TaxID=578462 RepID=A0A0L0TEK5_ALLM3|nr:hypothetical protein AMAG_17374 [Allomyces macrogynus ATCC 38327]|eukprot:KNE73182.1 hypothetical protein AMAG_17374 [Allomyces macrogynus ATCC 38327]